MGSSQSSPQRRNTDEQRQNLQYRSNRGDAIPVSNADSDLRRAGDLNQTNRNKYPKQYMNEEVSGRNFAEWESRTEKFYELPTGVNPRFDHNRRPTGLDRMVQIENNLHRNDRKTVVRNPPNDPGVHRAIATERPGDDGFEPSGLIYHPAGDAEGFVRAPLEPLDRRGRQHVHRYADDFDGDEQRSVTWPNRAEDAATLATHESRYSVRPRRNNGRRRGVR